MHFVKYDQQQLCRPSWCIRRRSVAHMIEQVAAYRDLAADGAAKQGEWHEHDGASFIETDGLELDLLLSDVVRFLRPIDRCRGKSRGMPIPSPFHTGSGWEGKNRRKFQQESPQKALGGPVAG
jgi:hypothetical protein